MLNRVGVEVLPVQIWRVASPLCPSDASRPQAQSCANPPFTNTSRPSGSCCRCSRFAAHMPCRHSRQPSPKHPDSARSFASLEEFRSRRRSDEEHGQLCPVIRPSKISDARQHGKRSGVIEFVITKGDGDAKHLQKPPRRKGEQENASQRDQKSSPCCDDM